MTSGLRIFAALGPGDIVKARRMHLAGLDIDETSIAFSEQLFSYCQQASIPTLAFSSNPRSDRLEDGLLIIENRAKIFAQRGGLAFHLSQLHYGIMLALQARRFKANVAILDSGTTHYFVLAIFRALGIAVAVNLHNVLWPRGYPPRGVAKLVRYFNGLFFRHAAFGGMGVSPECEIQLLAEARNRIPFFQYRCQFSEEGFSVAKPYEAGTFRIVFVGRIEENKGVLDIGEMARKLEQQLPGRVSFDICGDGPALQELRRLIKKHQLEGVITLHGRLKRDALLAIYSASHAAIVPTRSTFTEGMPQVCAEAALSGLPIIASAVTNTFDVLSEAVISAETDNIDSFVSAIISLIQDPRKYALARAATRTLSRQFLDRLFSYPAATDRLLRLVTADLKTLDFNQVFESLSQPTKPSMQ